jgi:hypothetical protein
MGTVVEAKWISWDDISVIHVFHRDIVFINFHLTSRWFLPFNFLANTAYVFIVFAILPTCSVHPQVCWTNNLYTNLSCLSIYDLFSFIVTLFLLRSNNFFTNRQTDCRPQPYIQTILLTVQDVLHFLSFFRKNIFRHRFNNKRWRENTHVLYQIIIIKNGEWDWGLVLTDVHIRRSINCRLELFIYIYIYIYIG